MRGSQAPPRGLGIGSASFRRVGRLPCRNPFRKARAGLGGANLGSLLSFAERTKGTITSRGEVIAFFMGTTNRPARYRDPCSGMTRNECSCFLEDLGIAQDVRGYPTLNGIGILTALGNKGHDQLGGPIVVGPVMGYRNEGAGLEIPLRGTPSTRN